MTTQINPATQVANGTLPAGVTATTATNATNAVSLNGIGAAADFDARYASIIQGYVGEVRQTFVQSPPLGWLIVPNATTNISRTSYPILNSLMSALSYPFGAGDGSTTFGMPFIPIGYTWVQASALAQAGVLTHGVVIAHSHNLNYNGAYASGTGIAAYLTGGTWPNGVGTTGGPDNLAAAITVNYIIRVG